MNEGKKELNIGIVGGGPGCKAILEMFEKEKFRELRANVIGVADVNEGAIGYQYAKRKGVFTTTRYQELYRDDLNLLIELTGKDEVLAEIIYNKPSSVKVIDHVGARLFWDFIQVEEERLRTQRELQRRTGEYRHLFESISGYVVVVDSNYRIVQMNKNAERDFGDVVGWHCYSAFKKRTQMCAPCLVEQSFKDGMSHEGEGVWTLPDGRTRWCTIHSSPVKDEKGETRYVMELTTDITEKKRLEVQLNQYTQNLEKMVEERTRDLQRVQEKIKSRNIELSALHRISCALSTSLELEDMLHATADEVVKVLGADSIGIYLMAEDRGNLELACSKGYSEKFYQKPVIKRGVGDGILGTVVEKRIPMIFEDLTNSQTPYLQIGLREGLKSAAYAPLMSKDKVFGVMRVSSHSSHSFSPEDVKHLTAIGGQIGVAIENSILHQRCKRFSQRLELKVKKKTRELERSYQELKKSEEKYRSLFDRDPNPIFIVDRLTLNILDVNSRSQNCYGYSEEELLQMSFMDLAYEKDENVVSDLKGVSDNKSVFYSKRRHCRKDGSPFYVNIHVCPAKYMQRDVLIATTTDITESVEKEAQLIQASKMTTVGTMASGMAHELNQPLTVIKMGSDFFLKMIKKGEKIDDEELRTIAKEIGTQVDRASAIINHLRNFTRPSDMIRTRLDINAPIRDVFKVLGQQLRVHQIEVELDLEESLPEVMADYNRLEQVFLNIVTNAMDAMDEKGNELGRQEWKRILKIRSSSENENVVVTVSDTGKGIPKEIINKIFEPFFTTKGVGKGTGLGMCISYGIVNDYGGTIEVESEVGKGTTFKLRFPACT